MKLLSAAQMQEMDRTAIEAVGIPGVVLMENAGRGLTDVLLECYAEQAPGPVVVLAGKGNNGGDGFVVARLLRDAGWQVHTVLLADPGTVGGDAAVNLQVWQALGGNLVTAPDLSSLETHLTALPVPALIVDALFGTGLAKPITGHYAAAVDWINRQEAPVVAVDIPSGVDATSGGVPGAAVVADLTVTFALAKSGQVSHPGAAHVGDLAVVDIGIPAEVMAGAPDTALLVDADEARALLPPRPEAGHKGTFGHLLVVAGSVGKTGAAVMAAESGLRGGAGLVTLACPQQVQPVLASQLIEVMTCPLLDVGGELSLQALDDLLGLASGKQALALGPGLGGGEEVGGLIRRLVQDCPLPMVLDADALTALSGHLDVLQRRAGMATVLTPHPGEMARLLGVEIAAVQADRLNVARAFAQNHGVVLVLKGARTVTAFPDGRVRINASGHPGMASGGTGDVLTGLIGSLLTQGLSAEAAATLGVFLHGAAADRLYDEFGDAGLLATDLMRELPAARKALV